MVSKKEKPFRFEVPVNGVFRGVVFATSLAEAKKKLDKCEYYDGDAEWEILWDDFDPTTVEEE